MGVRDKLYFGVLGPVEGWLDGAPLDLGPRKQRLVLAALLLEPSRILSTARLVALTWRDSPPPTARTAIQGRISRLRAVLAAAGADRVALVSAGSGYALRIDPGVVDAHRCTGLLASARAAHSDQVAANLYDEALRLWRGPALDGAVDELADARLRLGMHRDLVEHLTNHLVAHPTRERTARRLALALYRCGRGQ